MASLPSPTVPQLSQDIIDSIVDLVAHDPAWERTWYGVCPTDILNCSLVSRSFRHRAQFHIFEAIYIRGTPQKGTIRLSTLKTLIQSNPNISDYVHDIFLKCVDFQWISEDPLFLEVIESISRNGRPLRTLKVESVNRYIPIRISNFEPLLVNFFRPFIFPSITTLILERVQDVPLEVVAACINLKDLQLTHVDLVNPPAEKSRPLNFLRKPTLIHILTRHARPPHFVTRPSEGWNHYLNFSQLQTYKLCANGALDIQFEQQIINAAGGSLQSLTHFYGRPDVIDTTCPRIAWDLRDSTGLCVLEYEDIFSKEAFMSIIRTLETIPSRNSLRSFNIIAILEFTQPSYLQEIMTLDWERFCAEIIRISDGKSLDLSIRFDCMDSTDYADSEGERPSRVFLKNYLHGSDCASLVSGLLTRNLYTSASANSLTCSFDVSYNTREEY